MKPSPWMTFLVVGVTFNLACTDDIRGTKPDRTRDADGIIKLYRNQEQGDWMLKGKVVRVDVAVVVDVPRSGLALTVAGQTSLALVPITLRFHESEKGLVNLSPGDIISFKGRCLGKSDAIRFESCILLSISKRVPTS